MVGELNKGDNNLDIRLVNRSGLDVARQLQRAGSQSRIIILTSYATALKLFPKLTREGYSSPVKMIGTFGPVIGPNTPLILLINYSKI